VDFFRNVVYVDLAGTQVNDAGLEHLKGLSRLQMLWLCRTRVTDAGLDHLKGLSELTRLHLQGTNVTDAGVKKLQQALPKCQILSRAGEEKIECESRGG
jgi:hypothetical protein